MSDGYSEWVGRVETRPGVLTPVIAGMLGAALGHGASGAMPRQDGQAMPPLWHWAAFADVVPHDGLGPDGHPKRGGFLPPIALERRMWAGGRLSFAGRLHIGEPLERRSEILSVKEKSGGAGDMVFVTVEHRIEGRDGGRIGEEQDIVYIAMPDSYRPPKPIPAPDTPVFDEALEVNEVRLFRYSAATFNGHRIHYDLAYAQAVEKYPGLVVHGPMQASLLMEAALRHGGREPAAFRFRGVHPMFNTHGLRLLGTATADAMDLCTAADTGDTGGHQGLQAKITWEE